MVDGLHPIGVPILSSLAGSELRKKRRSGDLPLKIAPQKMADLLASRRNQSPGKAA